jgi:hypothetical protein
MLSVNLVELLKKAACIRFKKPISSETGKK